MTKRRRDSLLHLPTRGLNDSALAVLWKQFKAAGPDVVNNPVSRQTIARSALDGFAKFGKTTLLSLEGGRTFAWDHADPCRLLQYMARAPGFKALLESALRAQPATCADPWKLIVYFDGVTPGSLMRPDNTKKLCAIYFTFLNFGRAALCKQDAWLTFGVLRNKIIDKMVGGYSGMFRLILRMLCCGGMNMRTPGVHLGMLAAPTVLHAAPHNFLADLPALQSGLSTKGHAGICCCIKCRNVTSLQHGDVAACDAEGWLVSIACADPRRFERRTEEDCWEAVDALHAAKGHMSNSSFDSLEKATGFTYSPEGVLMDLELREHVRPVEFATNDPMHTFLQRHVPDGDDRVAPPLAPGVQHRVRTHPAAPQGRLGLPSANPPEKFECR